MRIDYLNVTSCRECVKLHQYIHLRSNDYKMNSDFAVDPRRELTAL